jgi:hypothetical protein
MIECIFAFGVLMLADKPLPHQYIGTRGDLGYVAFVDEKFESNWIELIDINGRSSIFESECKRVKAVK